MASGRQIAACLILVLAALSIAACGKDSPQGPKIPADTAETLQEKLSVVQGRMTAEDACGSPDTAQTSLANLQTFVDEIPEGDVDPQIISDLRELLNDLDEQLTAECDAGGPDAAETTSSETESTSTEIKTEKSTTTEETTEEPTTSSTTSSTDTKPETPETTPETPETPPSNGGGNSGNGGAQGGFEAGGTPAPGGKRVPANGGGG